MASLESLLSCVRKEHDYSVRREPTRPIQLVASSTTDDARGGNSKDNEDDAWCGVCRQSVARYTCPRCAIRYCCLECYNQHGGGTDDCKEYFFRGRTQQLMDLEAKERLDDTRQLIQRVYEQQTDQREGSSAIQYCDFSQEELLEIMRCLEEGDESKMEAVLQSDKVRRALSDSLGNGELLDYVLDTWTPWWRPELFIRSDAEVIEHELSGQATLDEKLAQVPALSTLHPDPSKIPNLQYNLVDILYASSWTLRLYHGYNNAMETGVAAGETLLKASSVLSNDARWENLPRVLSMCTTLSTKFMGRGCNASWSCLVQDVALICENPRYVAKALLEAIDILREAASAAKQQANDRESAAAFRKCRKKVEFYLSWCRESSNTALLLDGLSNRIESWGADWRLSEKGQDWQGLDRISSNTTFGRALAYAGETDVIKVVSTTPRGEAG